MLATILKSLLILILFLSNAAGLLFLDWDRYWISLSLCPFILIILRLSLKKFLLAWFTVSLPFVLMVILSASVGIAKYLRKHPNIQYFGIPHFDNFSIESKLPRQSVGCMHFAISEISVSVNNHIQNTLILFFGNPKNLFSENFPDSKTTMLIQLRNSKEEFFKNGQKEILDGEDKLEYLKLNVTGSYSKSFLRSYLQKSTSFRRIKLSSEAYSLLLYKDSKEQLLILGHDSIPELFTYEKL